MCHSFWVVAAVCAALGFLRCLIQTPLPLVIAETYNQRFVTAFSLYMVVCGVVAMIFGPLIGKIFLLTVKTEDFKTILVGFVKEVTQSHEMAVHLLTLAYLLCAIPWTIEIIIKKIKGSASEAT